MKKYLLGIDLGSGSIKLILLDKSGKVAGTASCEYSTTYPNVGWAEQNPMEWRYALKEGIRRLIGVSDIKADEIAAIAPDAATHTAVLLDSGRIPIDKAILWTDQRSNKEVAYLKSNNCQAVLKETLHTPTTVWTLPQLMWIRDNKPDTWKKIDKILFAKDYIRYCLTGALGTDNIDAAGSMFYNSINECWSETLMEIGKISKEWLPEIYESTKLAGYVTKEASHEFGLAEGTPVFVGTTDTVMEQLAAGSVEPGNGVVKLATAGRICVISKQAHSSSYLFNYRHVIPGLWYPGTATSSCAASFRWFRDNLGKYSFDILSEKAANIPAGSEGLMFHPYLQGELTPYNDPLLLASFTGISSKHTNAHFSRSVMEGVAFSLRDCLDTLEQEHLVMNRTRIIGGGAKSPLWRQIVADVLGVKLEKASVDDSSFGSALLAGVGVGWFESFKDAAERCITIESITYPNPNTHHYYEELYLRYKKIHDVLAPIYHDKTR